MVIADLHCDSLLKVNAEHGLVSSYNVSARSPFLQCFAIYLKNEGLTPEERRKKIIRILDTYLYETRRLNLVRVDSVLELNRACDLGLSGGILTLEGGGGLTADCEELQTLCRAGLRIMGLCWDSNELASGAWDKNDSGLSEEGKRLALAASDLGVTLDVSHLSDRSCDMLLDLIGTPIVATHSNFREVCGSTRNLTKEQARKIASRGGVIGLNLYPDFLSESGKPTKEDILRHVDYALTELGEDALAYGCDIDGMSVYPDGFSPDGGSIHDRLTDLLLSHYPASVVRKIAGENAINFLKTNFI